MAGCGILLCFFYGVAIPLGSLISIASCCANFWHLIAYHGVGFDMVKNSLIVIEQAFSTI
jgi:hypothetical protein